MKIRKRDRMNIYRKMLKYLRTQEKSGFCIALVGTSKKQHNIYDFIELVKVRPDVFYGNTLWWWDPWDVQKRINILETILKENEK